MELWQREANKVVFETSYNHSLYLLVIQEQPFVIGSSGI